MNIDKLALVIVTYNSEKYIEKAIKSASKIYNVEVTVFISDNASKDETVRIAKHNNAIVICNSENLGYSKAINKVVLTLEKFKYLLIMNPDAYLKTPFKPAEILSKNMTSLIGFRMEDEYDNYRCSTFYFPNLKNIILSRFRLQMLPEISKTQEVDAIEGSLMLMTIEYFKRLRGFDENIFLYGEDYEFCYRIKLIGGSVLFNPFISYVHPGGFNRKRRVYVHDGIKYFFKKHGSYSIFFIGKMIINIKALLIMLFDNIERLTK